MVGEDILDITMTDNDWYNDTDLGARVLRFSLFPRLQPRPIAVKSPPATIDAPRLDVSLF